MIIFGIESSCDDTAAAVLEYFPDRKEGRFSLLSNIVSSQTDIHAEYGGVVPEIAGRYHAEAISPIADKALRTAGIGYSDIDAVAVTFAPGLIGSLLVGVSFAKALAASLNVPLIPVNHIEAHASAAHIEHPSLGDDFLALIVSGGHTSFYNVENSVFTEIGGSRDDAAGEAFDKVGRVMGLPYPGGAAMDALAGKGFLRDSYRSIKLPSPAIAGSVLEFSFSGLKTAAINYINTLTQRETNRQKEAVSKWTLPDELREDIASAFTSVIVDGICAKVKLAIEQTGTKTLVMAGGVAANSHLRRAVGELCEKLGVTLCVPSLKLCADNGAMTAAAGAVNFVHGLTAPFDMNAFASDEAAEEYLAYLRDIKRN